METGRDVAAGKPRLLDFESAVKPPMLRKMRMSRSAYPTPPPEEIPPAPICFFLSLATLGFLRFFVVPLGYIRLVILFGQPNATPSRVSIAA